MDRNETPYYSGQGITQEEHYNLAQGCLDSADQAGAGLQGLRSEIEQNASNLPPLDFAEVLVRLRVVHEQIESCVRTIRNGPNCLKAIKEGSSETTRDASAMIGAH